MIEGIKLSYEIADSITLATLTDAKRSIQEDVDRLLMTPKLAAHQEIDLVNNLAILHHMAAVIKYYGGPDDERI